MIFSYNEGIANAFRYKGRHCQCLHLDIYLRFVKILFKKRYKSILKQKVRKYGKKGPKYTKNNKFINGIKFFLENFKAKKIKNY